MQWRCREGGVEAHQGREVARTVIGEGNGAAHYAQGHS